MKTQQPKKQQPKKQRRTRLEVLRLRLDRAWDREERRECVIQARRFRQLESVTRELDRFYENELAPVRAATDAAQVAYNKAIQEAKALEEAKNENEKRRTNR